MHIRFHSLNKLPTQSYCHHNKMHPLRVLSALVMMVGLGSAMAVTGLEPVQVMEKRVGNSFNGDANAQKEICPAS
jgi:hypothetical protein